MPNDGVSPAAGEANTGRPGQGDCVAGEATVANLGAEPSEEVLDQCGDVELRARRGRVPLVGRASFAELARGHIAANEDGFLKLVADADGELVLGVHIVGEGAAELVGLGQVAIQSQWRVAQFIESVFNFPTLAEAYRVAALDIAEQKRRRARGPG